MPLSILQNASCFYPSLSRFYPIIYIPLYENLHFFHRSYTLLKSAAPPCIWPAVLYKLEAETEALVATAREVMENACAPVVELAVPLVADAGIADNWMEAH